jgi:hypothetical protein
MDEEHDVFCCCVKTLEYCIRIFAYQVVSKIFRTDDATYTAVVVARISGKLQDYQVQ